LWAGFFTTLQRGQSHPAIFGEHEKTFILVRNGQEATAGETRSGWIIRETSAITSRTANIISTNCPLPTNAIEDPRVARRGCNFSAIRMAGSGVPFTVHSLKKQTGSGFKNQEMGNGSGMEKILLLVWIAAFLAPGLTDGNPQNTDSQNYNLQILETGRPYPASTRSLKTLRWRICFNGCELRCSAPAKGTGWA